MTMINVRLCMHCFVVADRLEPMGPEIKGFHGLIIELSMVIQAYVNGEREILGHEGFLG